MSKLRSFITNASNSKVRDARFSTQAGRGLAGTIRNVSSMNSKTEISTLTNTSFHKLDIPNDDLQVVQAPKQPYSWLQDLDSQICRSPKLTPPKPKERPFDRLINNITSYLASSPLSSRHPKISQLDSFLHDYSSDPSEWSKYAHPNPSKQYTRNFVCGIPGIFNLLILVWTPGRKSPVHDHADAHCLMKVLKGEITETRFAAPELFGVQRPMVQTSSVRYTTGQVIYMADTLGLHSVSNPHPAEYAVSLHLYTPPNAAIRGCCVYNEQDGTAQHVMQGAYDSISGTVQIMSH